MHIKTITKIIFSTSDVNHVDSTIAMADEVCSHIPCSECPFKDTTGYNTCLVPSLRRIRHIMGENIED